MDDLKRKTLNRTFGITTTDQVLEVTKRNKIMREAGCCVDVLTRTVGTSTSRVGSSKFGRQGMIVCLFVFVFFLGGGVSIKILFTTVEPPLR